MSPGLPRILCTLWVTAACHPSDEKSGESGPWDCPCEQCQDTAPPEPYCGDGALDPGEACDDGNDEPSDGCWPDCTIVDCGDGVVERFEECDDGNETPGDGCEPNCRPAPWVSARAGTYHSCALDADGRVECWGAGDGRGEEEYGEYGQGLIPEGTYQDVTVAEAFSCVLDLEGDVLCVGDEADGPTPPTGPFEAIDAGAGVCGLREGGAVVCWTDDGGGVADTPAGSFTQVSTGHGVACALSAEGDATCWGGEPMTPPSHVYSQVSAGDDLACAVDLTGEILCWGEILADEPTEGTYVQVSVGAGFACALDDGGAVTCWGEDGWGQCEPPEDSLFVQIEAGTFHACGVTDQGTIRCWGKGLERQTWVP